MSGSVEQCGPVELVGFVLASASPRRLELLATILALPIVRPAGIDEAVLPGESPSALVDRLARAKARHVVRPGEIALAADTVVVIDGDVLGKPTDRADAARTLGRLSGRVHQVMTGVAVADHRSGAPTQRSGVAVTEVRFAALSTGAIAAYVATDDPLDKAGAYGIQSGGGAFVAEVIGRYDNVVGLPLDLAVELLGLTAALGAAVATSSRPSS